MNKYLFFGIMSLVILLPIILSIILKRKYAKITNYTKEGKEILVWLRKIIL